MFLIFLKSFSIIISFFFLFMNHPLTMGLMLMLQTFLISLIIGMNLKSFWFSYMLFLIFVGAMLVLFIYIAALASNEMFNFFIKHFFYLLLFFSMLMLFMFNQNLNFNYNFNYENLFLNLNNFFPENSIMLMKIYNFPINMLSLILIIYLLLTLIISVKITNNKNGPLRQMNLMNKKK